MELKRQLGPYSAAFIIVADAVGTGIFMTTGIILGITYCASTVLALWVLGGIVALAGALCYSELASIWPDAGGEYVYLKNIYGSFLPKRISMLPSFLTGWISLFVGFSAPVAINALLIIGYIQKSMVPESGAAAFLLNPMVIKFLAAVIIIVFGILHIIGLRMGSRVQNVLTVIKIALITVLIGGGFYIADWSQSHRLTTDYTARSYVLSVQAAEKDTGQGKTAVIDLPYLLDEGKAEQTIPLSTLLAKNNKVIPSALVGKGVDLSLKHSGSYDFNLSVLKSGKEILPAKGKTDTIHLDTFKPDDMSVSIRRAAKKKASQLPFAMTGLTLLMVMFAYSGWNAPSYMAGEIKDPERNLPRAMFLGTMLVMVIYLLINVVYLMANPAYSIMGVKEIGAVTTQGLFSGNVSRIFNFGIMVILLSALSAQVMIGPRVYYAMARDRIIFKKLQTISPRFETPVLSIMIQVLISIVYLFIFDNPVNLLVHMGFSLNIFPLMAVIGLIILRVREPELKRPYRVHFYPVVPLIYIFLTIFMMAAALIYWTETSLFACAVVAAGVVVYFVWQKILTLKETDGE